jgi:rfaE bifunctional protein nucleotidyltransferase chain/domain
MFDASKKILTWEEAAKQIAHIQGEGKKVVFTNGCFDIVHLGHVDYLEKARNLGDFLVVGINSDRSIADIKGPSRPVVAEISRCRVMASFGFVDAVVVFDQPTPLDLIQTLKPDVLTKGQDYTVSNIVGANFVIGRGGKVETIPLVVGFSTSLIINKILSQPKMI